MTRPLLSDHRTDIEQGRISGPALFVPAVLVALALVLSGHHSALEIATAVVAFIGVPVVILALRRRSAHQGGFS